MRKTVLFLTGTIWSLSLLGQNRMTPELLWSLGRVTGSAISKDNKSLVYKVSTPVLAEDRSITKIYSLTLTGGTPLELPGMAELKEGQVSSPDSKRMVHPQEVKVKSVFGKDVYPDLDKSKAQIYESLNYRHWDEWEDGSFSHLIVQSIAGSKDIMQNEPYDCPQKPSGGAEDYTWSPDSKAIVYVCKKKFGTDYAISTNTDLYSYDLESGTTVNLTEGIMGYDTHPAFSAQGTLAWLSMKRDGYEADKNDILIKQGSSVINLTEQWDGTINAFIWSSDGNKLFFEAPIDGTLQLFEVDNPGLTKKTAVVRQITKGDFDVSALVGQAGNTLVVSRTDMNHAAELYTVNLTNGQMQQLTHVNDAAYARLGLSKIERRRVATTDGKQMLVWVVYPPDFDSAKKYPTLLYCQGGPQSALTQFYSFRWNLQLMAANGYIIVAPNRRGMPGFGVAWNEQISKDHGGQAIQDYLSAIDELAKEKFVDKDRLGCVGASYGGYSVFYLAGIHNNRFKTFIAHDGIFDLKSMYGTTEEMWFVNWDLGGPYWEKNNQAAQKSYSQFDPIGLVDKWNTPILIFHGAKGLSRCLGARAGSFSSGPTEGIKSKLVVFPDENHWVLHAQNALVSGSGSFFSSG